MPPDLNSNVADDKTGHWSNCWQGSNRIFQETDRPVTAADRWKLGPYSQEAQVDWHLGAPPCDISSDAPSSLSPAGT